MDSADRNLRWNPTNEDFTEAGDYDSVVRPSTLVERIDDREPPGFLSP